MTDGDTTETTDTALAIADLTVATGNGIRLVDKVNLTVRRGERVALVGESGSGKSVTARAVLGLNPGLRESGSIRVASTQVVGASARTLRKIRGSDVGMVFQDPLTALDPLRPIGEQVAEPLVMRGVRRSIARRRAAEILDDVGVAHAERRMRAYPHEFSGGMRQRAVLAAALITEPSILVADEPTTALDVLVQQQVLDLLDTICRERNLALLLITHDLGVVAGIADRIAVMYAGRIVEEGDIETVLTEPRHPYTAGLLRAVPRIDRPDEPLVPIPGTPPSPAARPTGCAFHPRCHSQVQRCSAEVPPMVARADGSMACCLLLVSETEVPA